MEAGAPSVDSPGELTNQNPLTLSGSAEASATIQIRGGADAVVETTATGDGSFEVSVPLRADAENTLLVSQVVDGAESPGSRGQQRDLHGLRQLSRHGGRSVHGDGRYEPYGPDG